MPISLPKMQWMSKNKHRLKSCNHGLIESMLVPKFWVPKRFQRGWDGLAFPFPSLSPLTPLPPSWSTPAVCEDGLDKMMLQFPLQEEAFAVNNSTALPAPLKEKVTRNVKAKRSFLKVSYQYWAPNMLESPKVVLDHALLQPGILTISILKVYVITETFNCLS